MLFNFACAQCRPEPLPVFVSAAVIDHMLDIPPFLRRDDPGMWSDTKSEANLVLAPVPRTAKPDPMSFGIDRPRSYDDTEDRRMRALILAREVEVVKTQTQTAQQTRRAEKAGQKAKLQQNKLAQRKTFMKHFSWGIDGL